MTFPEARLRLLLDSLRDGTHGTFVREDRGGVPLLSARNVQSSGLSLESPAFVSATDASTITSNGFPRSGDVLLTIVGTVGRSCVYYEETSLPFQRSVAFLRPGPRILARFLSYQLESVGLQDQMRLSTNTSAQPGLYLGAVGDLRVVIPHIDVQRQITDYLDRETARIDTLIDEQQRMLTILDERLSAQVDMVFGQAAGAVPTRLKWLIESISSGTSVNGAAWPADAGSPGVLKTSAVYGGVFRAGENKAVETYDLARVSCPVVANTLLVSRMNTPTHIGAAAAVLEDHPNLFLPDRLWSVSFSSLDVRYADWWTKSANYRRQVEASCVGTSSSMQNISQPDFVNFRIPVRSSGGQAEVVKKLDNAAIRFRLLQRETERLIDLARERRSALITAAVTGQLDVRGAAA